MRRAIGATAFWGLLLGCAGTAMACRGGGGPPDSISAYPGLAFFRPDLVLLYPVLSGTIERPFYSLAGFKIKTWIFSLQANLLASIVSAMVGFIVMILFNDRSLMWLALLAAPAVGMLVKLQWFRTVPREVSSRWDLATFAGATILSTGVISALPYLMQVFGTDLQSWAATVFPMKIVAGFLVFFAMIVLHVHLFTAHKRGAAVDRRRGFEILPAPAREPTPVAAIVAE